MKWVDKANIVLKMNVSNYVYQESKFFNVNDN
jgi:hypothetical protein